MFCGDQELSSFFSVLTSYIHIIIIVQRIMDFRVGS